MFRRCRRDETHVSPLGDAASPKWFRRVGNKTAWPGREPAGLPAARGGVEGIMPRIALYPGSFDPVTNGHLDVVRHAVVAV